MDIAPGGVASEHIENRTIRSEDIGWGQVTSDEIAYEAITPWELSLEDPVYTIPPRQYAYFYWRSRIPLAWGGDEYWEEPEVTWHWMYPGGHYYFFNDQFIFTIRVRFWVIDPNPNPDNGSSFYAVYDVENGWLMYVVRNDEPLTFQPLPEGMAYYDLENHPRREEIFEHPEEFIVDPDSKEIRKMTIEEKERHEEHLRRSQIVPPL